MLLRGSLRPKASSNAGDRPLAQQCEPSWGREVTIEPEGFIPLPRFRFKQHLLDHADPAQQTAWEKFFRIVESLVHAQYHRQVLQMKEDYLVLHPQAAPANSSPQEQAAAEQRFLDHFFYMMEKANFRPLSQQQVEAAAREDYLYMLPLQIDWDQLDGEFLVRFYRQHPQWAAVARCGSYTNKLLLFARGTGVDRTQGWFFLAKLDLVITGLLKGMFRPLIWLGNLGKSTPPPEPPDDTSQAQWLSESSWPKTHIHQPRAVQRILLRDAVRTWRDWFREVEIQEPTYAELVMVYRLKDEQQHGCPAPIHIKSFHHIPQADLEVVFPTKRISMKPLDLVKLVTTGCVGLVLAASKLIFSAVLNPVLLLTALATVVGYGLRLIFQFRASVNRYHQLVTDAMYSKNRDTDLGVVLTLMDEVEDQEFREMVLAYWLLVHQGPMDTRTLDQECEKYLKEHFGLVVDFEIHDALGKLRQLELVQVRSQRWEAVPLDQALTRLYHWWNQAVEFSQEPLTP